MEGVEVTASKPLRSRSPLTFHEERVLDALQYLPAEFEVEVGKRLQFREEEISYEPDFIVRRQDGRQVVLEVKSAQSLSMSNLSRLTRISHLIQQTGKGFLVIVLGPEFERSSIQDLNEFHGLHVRTVGTDREILSATLGEFEHLPKRE
jgi:hypothetical protein